MEWLEIFDISLFRSLIRSATPIALIGFGAAMCSAAGVLNIGLEVKIFLLVEIMLVLLLQK